MGLMPKRPDLLVVCSECGGRKLNEAVRTRSRKGGNASYLASLKPGGLPMGQRGGGAKRLPTLEDLLGAEANKGEGSEASIPVGLHNYDYVYAFFGVGPAPGFAR